MSVQLPGQSSASSIVELIFQTRYGNLSLYIPYRMLFYCLLISEFEANYTRIIELNVGIICSCLPIIVVLFKDVTKNPKLLSLKRYLQKRHGSSGGSEDVEDESKPTNGLPNISSATLNGLRTFIRRMNRTERIESTQMSTFNQLSSLEEDYHEYLKANGTTTHNGIFDGT